MESSRNFIDPSSSSINLTGLLGTSGSNEYNILRDNYSLEEIFNSNLVELKRLLSELTVASSEENSIPVENTRINFTTLVKDKKDHIINLLGILHEEEPNSYPKYRVEAYLELFKNLKEETIGLEEVIKRNKNENQETKAKIERIEHLILEFEKVMGETTTPQTETEDSVCLKLADIKFKESQTRLNTLLDLIFPGNKQDIIVELFHQLEMASEEEMEEEKWINVNEDMDESVIVTLVRADVIKRSASDPKKVSLNCDCVI